MVSIPAGRRDRRIRIEQPVNTPSDRGGSTVSWTLFAKRWAEIVPLRGREAIEAQALQARFDTVIRFLRLDGLTTAMRIVDGNGQIYDIRHIAEIGRRDGHECQCSAREGDEV